jgi:hypothetical protein
MLAERSEASVISYERAKWIGVAAFSLGVMIGWVIGGPL